MSEPPAWAHYDGMPRRRMRNARASTITLAGRVALRVQRCVCGARMLRTLDGEQFCPDHRSETH